MVTVASSHGHAETLRRLLDAIAGRGLNVFVQIDHAAAAREVGMDLAPELVVVFGNPRVGTPLMQRDAGIGIELPLRMLVWNDAETTTVGYNDPRELAAAYDIGEHGSILDGMAALLSDLAQEAAT